MPARFDAIGVVVDDIKSTLEFYRRLGLEFPPEAESGDGHFEATNTGGVRLMFDTVEVIQSFSDWKAGDGSARFSLAFACDSPAEVDAIYQELTGLGYHGEKEPWDAFWGQRYAILHDPSGNEVDLFAAL
jgi:catechol 2,3-dioxygenase-like lactoylglutathione lyase family enzyme